MIILASTDVISLVTSAAASIDVHASWMDTVVTGGVVTVTPGRVNTAAITTATTTTVVAAPAASTYRNVKFLSVRNNHATVACDVTLQHNDGTLTKTIIKTTLQPGECLVFYDGAFQQFLASGALKTTDSTNVSITGGVISGADFTAKAGTTASSGFHRPTGVLTTTPVAGDEEYDGVVLYDVPVASERGVRQSEQFITQQGGTRTLASQTAAQKIFGTPTNGALTVGAGRSYWFEGSVSLSAMSATSGAFGFAFLGTATFTIINWISEGVKAALATSVATAQTYNTTAANTALVAATTNTVGWFYVKGLMRINAGGTIIPAVSLGIAAAAVVGQDAWFRFRPIGSGTVTSVGNWS
jgi:hypothetical protein